MLALLVVKDPTPFCILISSLPQPSLLLGNCDRFQWQCCSHAGKPGCCMLLSYSIFFVPHARTSIKNRNPFSSWFEGLDFWESGTCTCFPDVSQQRAFHGYQRKCASLNLSSLNSIMEALSCDLISSYFPFP